MYYDPIISGKRMQQIRKQKNLGTQHDIDYALGVGNGTYGNIERGQPISIDMAVCIAAYFNVTLDFLVLGINPDSSSDADIYHLLKQIYRLCLDINNTINRPNP